MRVVEMEGIGPGPLAGQLLADLGAEVVVIGRSSPLAGGSVNRRGKRLLPLDLKREGAVAAALAVIARADLLIEGFRPGVMERLGLGPDACLAANPALVYGRMTGWGQDGPLAGVAGHDLTYLALTGALHMIGREGEPPVPPLNLVADYGGGTMMLLFGLLAGLAHAARTGQGQVVDAAMVDGVPALMGLLHAMQADGSWSARRESNLLDGGAPFYRCYACADGRFLAVAPLEPQFFAVFVRLAGLPQEWCASQYDRSLWPQRRAALERLFATRPRDDWAALFEGSDACVAPVLDMDEAARHPHMAARGVFIEAGAVRQGAPAPRFSATPAGPPRPFEAGAGEAILRAAGLDGPAIAALGRSGALRAEDAEITA